MFILLAESNFHDGAELSDVICSFDHVPNEKEIENALYEYCKLLCKNDENIEDGADHMVVAYLKENGGRTSIVEVPVFEVGGKFYKATSKLKEIK